MSALFRLIGLFITTDNKLVLLSSYGGDQYSDSPRVLFEAMKKDSRFKNLKYVWAFSNPQQYDVHSASKVKIDTFKYFKTALKAKIWITNVNIERGLKFKKKKTIYLNTWHGTGPKKGGNAVKGRKDYDFSKVDIFCCDGQYTHDVFVKWFNVKEKNMLWCGRPREDELFQFTSEDKEKIRKQLNIPRDKKIILYMPTWREYGNKDLNYDLWENTLDNEYMVIVRSHHFTKDYFAKENNNFWKDVSDYPDVNELYYVADILISDYSSAFFDYGLLGKPMFCYAYDYEKYKNEYGLFMDLEHEFPNGVIEDEKILISTILNMDYKQECKKSFAYCNKYVHHNINATQCCLDRIYYLLGKNDGME